jgi:hypothetical protein
MPMRRSGTRKQNEWPHIHSLTRDLANVRTTGDLVHYETTLLCDRLYRKLIARSTCKLLRSSCIIWALRNAALHRAVAVRHFAA